MPAAAGPVMADSGRKGGYTGAISDSITSLIGLCIKLMKGVLVYIYIYIYIYIFRP